jgi:hypothetical protein
MHENAQVSSQKFSWAILRFWLLIKGLSGTPLVYEREVEAKLRVRISVLLSSLSVLQSYCKTMVLVIHVS